jgi:hypothetical protein
MGGDWPIPDNTHAVHMQEAHVKTQAKQQVIGGCTREGSRVQQRVRQSGRDTLRERHLVSDTR